MKYNVFILGAGFSHAISPKMPLLKHLSELVIKEAKTEGLIKDDLDKKFQQNIELFLTYLSQSHPWLSKSENLRNRALFIDIATIIGDKIRSIENQITKQPPPDWLLKLIKYWDKSRSKILTLNYDCLIERAVGYYKDFKRRVIKKFKYPVDIQVLTDPKIQGLIKEFTNEFKLDIYKLHGSINWFYSGSPVYYGEQIYQIGLIGWYADLMDIPSKEYAKIISDKVPLIVPPTIQKTDYFQNEKIQAIWYEAGKALKNAKNIYCIGYSLPETDMLIRFFLEDNAPIQKHVPFYIVNTDKNIVKHYENLLPSCYYEIKEEYVCENQPVEKLVEDLVQQIGGRI